MSQVAIGYLIQGAVLGAIALGFKILEMKITAVHTIVNSKSDAMQASLDTALRELQTANSTLATERARKRPRKK